MGKLIDGTWTRDQLIPSSPDGSFQRADSTFRNWITRDGGPGPTGVGGFAPASGRYHLYVSYACPWAHRTLIFRHLKQLTDHIDVSVVHPDMFDDGWTFDDSFPGTTGDRLHGATFLHEVYTRADPRATTRVTVPILWDTERDTIVANESADIIRMFNSAFNDLTGNTDDYYPEPLRDEIERINSRVYDTLNNGVYRSGFARSQSAYDTAVGELFDTLDWLEDILSRNRYLTGDQLTEADWRLYPTLVRFDPVYHTHFKCNRNFLRDYPNLQGYLRELYQVPGVAGITRPDHFVRHYYVSHESINPARIIPINPEIDLTAPHGRG